MTATITLASSNEWQKDSHKDDIDSFRKQAEENEGQFAIISSIVRNGGTDVDFSESNWTQTMVTGLKLLFILPL
jgi:hypothetical protein